MKKAKAKSSTDQLADVEADEGDAVPPPKKPRYGPLTADHYRMAAAEAAFYHCDPKKAEHFERLALAAEERERAARRPHRRRR